MLNVVKSPQAYDDLAAIALAIGQLNVEAALRFLDAAEQTFHMLSLAPYIGERISAEVDATAGFRVRTIVGFRKYLVYYRPRGEFLEVARVVYGGRDQRPLIANLP